MKNAHHHVTQVNEQIPISDAMIDALARLYQWAWEGRHNVAITLANARLFDAGLDVPREHGDVVFVTPYTRRGRR